MKKLPQLHESAPETVQIVKTLGRGRAAQARLVDATFGDGRRVRCVEKVFAPGFLTRFIYRIAFQAPFAYQTNFDAIAACFYRRRVAAAALAAGDQDAKVAMPLYTRYDEQASAWVLAATWIDGRGVRPSDVDDRRLCRLLTRWGHALRDLVGATTGRANHPRRSIPQQPESEMSQLVRLMRGLEDTFLDCGLIGSGWQVSPTALVSTANLLRKKDSSRQSQGSLMTIIDLESGIPAVLVPRYVMAGAMRGILPMFDDVDEGRLRHWLKESSSVLTFRIGPLATRQLHQDVEHLIRHSRQWKASEIALTRRPWRLLTTAGALAYRRELFRRWRRRNTVDPQTAESLCERPVLVAWLWCLGWIPTRIGHALQRMAGDTKFRFDAKRFLFDPGERRRRWKDYSQKCQGRWESSERIPRSTELSPATVIKHRLLQSVTLPSWHRWMVDSDRRRLRRRQMLLTLTSSRYQSWLGRRYIEACIEKWLLHERVSESQADRLRESLSAEHVRVYTRGFGMHLGLKAIAPVIGPAKVGGIAAYVAGASLWMLLIPFLLTPVLRTLVTLASMWSVRRERVPHFEALAAGLVPTLGTLAFPIQMFTSCRGLSTFLIRDAASRAGRHLPIYGGPDSRTEIAMIRATDYLIEAMTVATDLLGRLRGGRSAAEAGEAGQARPEPNAVPAIPRTTLGRRLDELAIHEIAASSAPEESHPTGVGGGVAA